MLSLAQEQFLTLGGHGQTGCTNPGQSSTNLVIWSNVLILHGNISSGQSFWHWITAPHFQYAHNQFTIPEVTKESLASLNTQTLSEMLQQRVFFTKYTSDVPSRDHQELLGAYFYSLYIRTHTGVKCHIFFPCNCTWVMHTRSPNFRYDKSVLEAKNRLTHQPQNWNNWLATLEPRLDLTPTILPSLNGSS